MGRSAAWGARLPLLLTLTVAFCGLARQAPAQDVTLTAQGGTLSISGRLISHDDKQYRVETAYGPVTVQAGRVTCTGACPDLASWVPRLRLAGPPGAVRVLLPALWEAYALRHSLTLSVREGALRLSDRQTGEPVADLTLIPATAPDALAMLDTGAATYALTLGERGNDAVEAKGETRPPRVLALDGWVPVVSRANPRADITLTDLRAVLTGTLTDWSALGAAPGPIRLHLPDRLQDGALLPPGNAIAPNATLHADSASLTRAVARDRSALGLARQSDTGPARALPLSGACGRPIAATPTTLKAEDYPLTLPLLLFGPRGREAEIATAFFDWAGTAAAARVIARAGAVAPGHAEVPLAAQGARLANAIRAAGDDTTLADLQTMLAALDGAKRLTATFRFRVGATTLDAQSRANVTQLARAISSGVFAGRTILLAGFTDGDGPGAINERLALRRAETVRAALLEVLPDGAPPDLTLETRGFGEALPMACDDTDWGRQVNRRVEVWLR